MSMHIYVRFSHHYQVLSTESGCGLCTATLAVRDMSHTVRDPFDGLTRVLLCLCFWGSSVRAGGWGGAPGCWVAHAGLGRDRAASPGRAWLQVLLLQQGLGEMTLLRTWPCRRGSTHTNVKLTFPKQSWLFCCGNHYWETRGSLREGLLSFKSHSFATTNYIQVRSWLTVCSTIGLWTEQ